MKDSPDQTAPLSEYTSLRIADMVSEERPREKAIAAGSVRNLTVVELIAIALGSGMPGRSVIDISREIYKHVGENLIELGRLQYEELVNIKGVGPAKAISVLAAIELGTRIASEMGAYRKTKTITDSSVIATHMSKLKLLNHEEFWVLFVDRRNMLMSEFQLSIGGTSATVVDTKIIFKKALLSLASGMIVVHNHPSGSLLPSAEDDRLTRRLQEGCRMLDIRMLDHVIVAAGGHYSYNDSGRL